MGVTPEAFAAKNWVVEEGRAILASDLDSARNVCILGHALAKKVFPRSSGLHETIKFHGINYRVIGILAAKGGAVGGDQDNYLAIPLTTGLNRYSRYRSLNILVQAQDAASFSDTVEQVRGILRTIRKVAPGKPDDFEVVSNDSLITQFKSLTLAIRVGVALVSSIALLAAGVGIMNIMLVSVTERTREIGIRRAIGAKKRSIMTQFIMEAVSICEVGGVMGVLLGVAGGNLVAYFLKVPLVIPLDWVIIGLVICSIVGVIFGTYPAFKAANLDPIDSLRYE
jgi:putative ABC transport system permease protein